MNVGLICLGAAMLLASEPAQDGAGDGALPSSAADSVPALSKLSTDLLGQALAEKPNENVMVSAWSVQQAVGMLRLGARGRTETELAHFLRTQQSSAEAGEGAQQLREAFAGLTEAGILSTANGIWLREGESVQTDFLEQAAAYYDASVEATQFPHPGVGRINTYVTQNTQGMITELFRELPGNTVLVLVNAVAFKDNWAMPFTPQFTRNEPFSTGSEASVMVPMMQRNATVQLAKVPGATVARLRYESGMSMQLALPDEGTDVKQVLTQGAWLALDLKFEEAARVLKLPRWKSAYEMDLMATMQKLGVVAAFDPARADFTGIQPVKGLYVSKAVHKTFVEVDEVGTKAAAATGIAMPRGGPSDPPPTLAFNRPFTYAIVHSSGLPLFTGVVRNPNGK